MSDLLPAKTDVLALAVGTGLEEHPMLYPIYRMLIAGQHPLAVQEKVRMLGGQAELDAIVRLKATMVPPSGHPIYPDDVLTDPLADFHKAFALQKERVQRLIEREEESGEHSQALDNAIIALQESAERLTLLMKKMGYNPYAQETAGEERGRPVSLSVIMNATREQLKQIIAGDVVDGEVTEL